MQTLALCKQAFKECTMHQADVVLPLEVEVEVEVVPPPHTEVHLTKVCTTALAAALQHTHTPHSLQHCSTPTWPKLATAASP
jgi:hypothetical protein